MKKGWEVKPVTAIAKHSLGKMLDKAKNRGTLRPYLRNLNVRWFEFDLSDLQEMRFLPEETDKFTAIKGDVLVCEGGYPGRAAIWEEDEPIHFQKAIHRVRFHEPDRNKWFVYYLHFLELTGQLKQYCSGTGIQHFTGQALARLPIPVPPLPEQRRIVAILDKAFEGIAAAKVNAERAKQNVKSVFEAALDATFDSEDGVQASLDSVCSIESSLVDPREKAYANLLHVGGANMETVSDELIALQTAKEEGLVSGKFAFAEDVVLYSKIRPYLRKVCRPPFSGLCSADVYPLTPKADKIDRGYLYYLLLSPQFTRYAVEGSARAGMPKVNRPHLFAYQFALPDLGFQRQVGKKLDAIRKTTQSASEVVGRKITALDELKASLLHQAFTGAL